MKRLLFAFALLIAISLFGDNYDCNSGRFDYGYKVSQYSHKNCPTDSVYSVYINSVVRDTLLMDKIIDAVDNIYNNDSLYNLIKNEYFQAWDRNEKYEYFQISAYCKHFVGTINKKLIPKDFDRTILTKEALSIIVMLSFHDAPYGAYCSYYKGRQYFFDNTALISPTSDTIKIMEADNYDITHLYDFLTLNFLYYNGRMYLHPEDDIWHCYQ